MTDPAPRPLIEFSGTVDGSIGPGALLSLTGQERGVPATAHLAATDPASLAGLPAQFEDLRILELPQGPGDTRCFQLQARGLCVQLRARSLQVHRNAAREFFAVVPPVAVPVLRRAGWSLLLALLRVPGFVGLIKRLREST